VDCPVAAARIVESQLCAGHRTAGFARTQPGSYQSGGRAITLEESHPKDIRGCNIKLGSVASDILGKSGRAMLTAMIEGSENPQQLADLAQGQLRLNMSQLVEALRGRVRTVLRFRLQQQLARVDFIDAQIAELEAEIEKQNAPMEEAVSLLA
jgi:hypothetical protein